jgi:small-conductance mechanosensitive channel
MTDVDDQIAYAQRVLDRLFGELGAALPGMVAGLAVIVVFVFLASLARALLRRLVDRVPADKRPLVELAGGTARYALIVVGLIMGLGTMGIDVSALVAGLGLTGFALGFALRDAVSNLLAGVLIIFYQPFRMGDTITVAGRTGKVVAIDFRYTVLAMEGKRALVPNNAMFSNTVVVEDTAD